MIRYVVRRTLAAVVVVFLVATLTFLLVQTAPGGLSVLMDLNATREDVARLERILGLDRPVHVQYWHWLRNVLRGDFGGSLSYGGRPVVEMVMERVPATFVLGLASILITILVGIPAGVLAARHQNRPVDQLVSVFASLGLALPNFWLGLLLIILFGVRLQWLPTTGIGPAGADFDPWVGLRHLILPAVVLATSSTAAVVRYTRSSYLEVVALDHVRTAHSKGLPRSAVDRKHVLRNALIPVVTVVGVQLPRLVGGAAVVETLFSWPGLGQLGVDAALRRDTPLILGVTMLISVAVVFSSLLVDLIYPLLDPRIRYG